MPWAMLYGSTGVPRSAWKPFRMPRWPDNLLDSVFYLYPTREDARAARNLGACGFLVSVPWDHPRASESTRHIYAVSNYHAAVRDGASVIRLNTKDEKSDVIETDPCEWLWQYGSDLAVHRIDGSVHFTGQTIWQYAHVPFNEANCTAEVLREYQLGPGDDVVSIGRFVDIHGLQQNTPLIRSGIIASGGVLPIRTDRLPWTEEACWMIEMRSRTGFSGSPVYAYIPPWQPNFIDAPSRKYGNFFHGPWLLGVHSSRLPGDMDTGSTHSGMAAVVPCSALETLLKRDKKVRDERAAYENKFIDAPTAQSDSAVSPDKAANPRHKEDFTALLNAAAKTKPQDR